MSRDTECPYCGEDVEINHDDGYGYSEDETHQQECGACGKTFTYTTMIHFSYRTRRASALMALLGLWRKPKCLKH